MPKAQRVENVGLLIWVDHLAMQCMRSYQVYKSINTFTIFTDCIEQKAMADFPFCFLVTLEKKKY